MKKDLVAIGSVAFDGISTPIGKREKTLGGSLTHFINAASFKQNPESSTGIVGVVGKDFNEEQLNFFKKRNIDITDLQIQDGKTFFWEGYYEGDMNQAHTLKTELNVFADFNPQISEVNQNSRFLFLGNIAPELQNTVLENINYDYCFMDTMNFWLETQKDTVIEVLKKVQGLIINDGEAFLLTGEENPLHAAPKILEMGPDYLIIKKGSHGVSFFAKDGSFFQLPAYPVESLTDPTGAGDSFAGGFISYLASQKDQDIKNNPETFKNALVYGTILASFNVEGFGVEGLSKQSSKTIENRFQKYYHFSSFEKFL